MSGIGVTGAVTATSTWTQAEYLFTATATSHTLQCFVRGNSGFDTQGDVYFDDIKLEAVGATYRPTTVTRVDANGSHPVRLLDGQEPISGSMTVTDYEAALTGTIRYDVVDAANVTTSASTTLGSSSPWLHCAVLPQFRQELDFASGYAARRAFLGTVHRPIGRRAPLTVTGPLGTREGTLKVWCSDYATALAVAAVADLGETITFRQPTHPGLDMYLLAQSVSVEPDESTGSGWRWTVALDYIEVDVPSDSLKGAAGWTFASVSGGYATFVVLPLTFTDFADLVAGP